MKSRQTVKDRVTILARDFLAPPLRDRGFRRTGRVFWRDSDANCQIISLKLGRFGTSHFGTVDVFLGVFWHEVEQLLQNPSAEKMPAPEYRCTFRIDLGWTTPTRLQKSWDVDLKTDLDLLAGELVNDVIKYALPWLNYRSKIENVLKKTKFVKRFPGGATSHEHIPADRKVAFMALLGKRDEARLKLQQFIKNGHEESAKIIAKQLGLRI